MADNIIVDLHTHTLFSDGSLIPAESARRAKMAGYTGIAITDHVDHSNYKDAIKAAINFKDTYRRDPDSIKIIVGAEITHVCPSQISELTKLCRSAGAEIVLVHGETILEPVSLGTNRAAILAGVDVLAHPGIITEEDAKLAAERNVHLEITTRWGHSFANGHVVRMAKLSGARLVVNNDSHAPKDYVGTAFALKVLQGAGLTVQEAHEVIGNTVKLFDTINKKGA